MDRALNHPCTQSIAIPNQDIALRRKYIQLYESKSINGFFVALLYYYEQDLKKCFKSLLAVKKRAFSLKSTPINYNDYNCAAPRPKGSLAEHHNYRK